MQKRPINISVDDVCSNEKERSDFILTIISACPLYVTGINKTLDQYSYTDSHISELIVESFHQTEFIGVRGYSRFDQSGETSGVVAFSQQQGHTLHWLYFTMGHNITT